MSWVVRFHPDAEKELRAAQDWYRRQQRGLGDDFRLCVEEAIQKLQQQPESYPVIYEQVRQVIVRRFPYTILYSIEYEEIVVHAVFHASRNPSAWQERI